ncbi:MAG: flavin reductase [Lachnospiraceae bacterium]|nr:flavin reductase [Lachnospiraceae bacterium]
MKKISTDITNDFCPQTLFLYGTYKEDHTPNFGLFCWFSYYWDTELGVMACIGGNKLTKERIHATKVFSANLVTEEMLPLADYFGNKEGYELNKMDFPLETTKGAVLDVPVLSCSPVTFELEVDKFIPMDDGEVLLCKIRNVLIEESLKDESATIEERIRKIAPINTTCETYFSWSGKKLGAWGEPKENFPFKK